MPTRPLRLMPSPLVIAVLAALGAGLCGGCGGGGGGGGVSPLNRTYSASTRGFTFALTVDAGGRFTLVFDNDEAGGAVVTGAQGTMARDGTFFGQSQDAQYQFSGRVSGDPPRATVTVRKNGSVVADFQAPSVAGTGVTPSNLRGTFAGVDGLDAVYLTTDGAGVGTLLGRVGGAMDGGQYTLSATNELTIRGQVVGRFVVSGSDLSLNLLRFGGSAVDRTFPLSQTARAKWTFLVFLNAANDLQRFGPLNVNQMEMVGSSQDVNIVVQWKQANCVTCGSPDWVGTRRYYITRDNNPTQVTSPVVQELGQNVDMGDWRELRNFIVWAQERYPAERYALVVWNHGAGWRITRDNKLGKIPRSVSIDDHTRNEIQVWQLPQALNVNPQVDMLIFDASLMQMIEVAYEVRNATSIMVGSEESPPGEGYVYNAFLVDLVGNPGITPAQFGAKIVQRTFEQYGYNGDNTQSAVDLSKMETVKDRLNDFALRLLARGPSEPDLVRDARQNAESYAYPENKDLWDYADRIANGTGFADLRTAARGLQSAIESAVIANEAGRLNRNSHGLSVYVPTPTAYLTSYANLAITRVTSWDEWLQAQPR